MEPVVQTTTYALQNDDGTVERFVVESFPLAKHLQIRHYECKTEQWYRVKLLNSMLLKGGRDLKAKQHIYHKKLEKSLRQIFKHRLIIFQ